MLRWTRQGTAVPKGPEVIGPVVAVLCWGRAAAAIQSEPLRADFSQRRRSGTSLDVAKGGTRWPDTSTHPGM